VKTINWSYICNPLCYNDTLPSRSFFSQSFTRALRNSFPRASANGTATAFPICLNCYRCVRVNAFIQLEMTHISHNCCSFGVHRFKQETIRETLRSCSLPHWDDPLQLLQNQSAYSIKQPKWKVTHSRMERPLVFYHWW
jgi:hypothetical protein